MESCPPGFYECKRDDSIGFPYDVKNDIMSTRAICIPNNKLCDTVKDCPLRDDEFESLCHCREKEPHFKCKGLNGKCIPRAWVCDSVKDCPLGDDEEASQTVGTNATCVLPHYYTCLGSNLRFCELSTGIHRKIIPSKWRCDGEQDCEKGMCPE
jgi:hypothetical protein